MEQKIVALVDGSAYSEKVCEQAAWLALRLGAPVELIHVLGQRESSGKRDLSGSIRLGARTKLMEELAELDAQRAKLVSHRGRAILEDARAILDQAGVNEITTRLRHGDIVESIADIEADAQMIVIGKRGEAADYAQGHLGSNLERIVRAAHRPVFVAARDAPEIAKVLVAYDGRDSAMKAIDHMARSRLFRGWRSRWSPRAPTMQSTARGWPTRRHCSGPRVSQPARVSSKAAQTRRSASWSRPRASA